MLGALVDEPLVLALLLTVAHQSFRGQGDIDDRGGPVLRVLQVQPGRLDYLLDVLVLLKTGLDVLEELSRVYYGLDALLPVLVLDGGLLLQELVVVLQLQFMLFLQPLILLKQQLDGVLDLAPVPRLQPLCLKERLLQLLLLVLVIEGELQHLLLLQVGFILGARKLVFLQFLLDLVLDGLFALKVLLPDPVAVVVGVLLR